jgi:glutaredoxin
LNKVEIYTGNNCNYCHDAKEYFNKNNIEYVEYNISEDKTAKKKLMSMSIMSVPYILVNDNGMLGFDEIKFKELFNG